MCDKDGDSKITKEEFMTAIKTSSKYNMYISMILRNKNTSNSKSVFIDVDIVHQSLGLQYL